MSLKKNLVSNFLLTSSSLLFPLITFPFITRVLSNDSIGRVFFVDAFTQYFIVISSLGIPFYGIREISKLRNSPSKRSTLVVELISIQLVLALVFSVVFFVLYFLVPSLNGNFDLIILGCICIVFNAFMIEWFYQGLENFSFITVRALILRVISVFCIVLFIKSGTDHFIYYLIVVGLLVLNSVVNIANYFRNFHTKFILPLNFKQHLKPLLLLFSINIAVSVYTVLDTIILGLYTNALSVSYYNIPLKLVKMYWIVVSGLGIVMVPRIVSLVKIKDVKSITLLLSKSFSLVFLLTIPFSFFCCVFANEILILISGEKYINSSDSLRVLSFAPFIIGCCNVLGTQFLMPMGMEKKILHATIVGLIVSLSLNIFLIPYFSFLGAAIACIAAEVSVFVYVFFVARKHISVSIDYMLLAHIFLSLLTGILFFFISKGCCTEMMQLFIVLAAYLTSFLLLQIFVFKNSFVNILLKFSI